MREPAAKPAKQRSLVEIIDAAVELINPPAKARALCRAKVEDRIQREQSRRPSSRVARVRPYRVGLQKYLMLLRRTRVAAAVCRSSTNWLDREIDQVTQVLEQVDRLPRQPASMSLNLHKVAAVHAAADLLDPSVERCRARLSLFPDDPQQVTRYQSLYGDLGYECPWRQELTLYDAGLWHQLSQVVYEALTGSAGADLMHYCSAAPR
jgi:hypothetical protein